MDFEKREWKKLPPNQLVSIAFGKCPQCNASIIAQPIPGRFVVCPECKEMLVVFVLPLLMAEGKNCCALFLLMNDGRHRLLYTPGAFEFGEWVL